MLLAKRRSSPARRRSVTSRAIDDDRADRCVVQQVVRDASTQIHRPSGRACGRSPTRGRRPPEQARHVRRAAVPRRPGRGGRGSCPHPRGAGRVRRRPMRARIEDAPRRSTISSASSLCSISASETGGRCQLQGAHHARCGGRRRTELGGARRPACSPRRGSRSAARPATAPRCIADCVRRWATAGPA